MFLIGGEGRVEVGMRSESNGECDYVIVRSHSLQAHMSKRDSLYIHMSDIVTIQHTRTRAWVILESRT